MKIAIVIPFFNERERITKTLSGLSNGLEGLPYECILINDHSHDSSEMVVQNFIDENLLKWTILTNPKNLGHGPSVVRGLRWAVKEDYNFIATIDGDGEIEFSDFRKLIELGLENEFCVIEGTRRDRNQTLNRSIVSKICKIIVLLITRKKTHDANTPFHCFPKEVIQALLFSIPSSFSTPNLLISILLRKRNINRLSSGVRVTVPESNQGTTWAGSSEWKRIFKFLKFSIKAFRELKRLLI